MSSSFEGPEFGVGDFVLLNEISLDEFMKNLKLRFEKDKIYTFIGEVVVSVNPYKDLNIYGQEHIKLYKSSEIYERPPHLFAVAEAAYKVMKRQVKNSCIVISGESGSGKTEASKYILKYISAITNSSGRNDIEKVKNILIQSNIILECFGNAKTNRNDNSSRFGKYMDILFDFKCDPIGGQLINYLLEKSRVVYQQTGERNFHSFYNLMLGASEADLAKEYGLKQSDLMSYNYISQGGAHLNTNMNDKQNFKLVNDAMKIVNFEPQLIKTIWQIVASIIHLGNLKFESIDTDLNNNSSSKHANQTRLTQDSMKSVREIARMLKISEVNLVTALTSRTIASGNKDIVKTALSVKDALYARDSLAKAMYEQLFTYIFSKINEILDIKNTIKSNEYSAKNTTVIGVLDIYGFEIFDLNGFEQFCINYCNEKLQQLFIELVLKQEQEEYQRENINWQHIDYFNNKIICDLVEMPHKGMISILDEASYNVGKVDDELLLDHLSKQLKDHKHFSSRATNLSDKTLSMKTEFRISHYAGDVKYQIKNFIDKNRDLLYQDFKRVLYNSENVYLKQMWPEGAQSINEITKRPTSVATRFKNSMIGLVQNLSTKDPFYVRCIKPNESKSPHLFDYDKVKNQVYYLGLLENVRVRRAGFAYRLTYEKFLQRYKCLSKKTWPNPKSGKAKDNVAIVLKECSYDSDCRYGVTKLFIKSPQTVFGLEAKRTNRLPQIVTYLQKFWRGTLARMYYRRLKAANKIATAYKAYKLRKFVRQLYLAYGKAKQMKDYGKSVAWPRLNSKTLKQADDLLRKIYIRWRAHMILKPYPPAIRAEIYLLSLSCELIKNRPINSSLAQKWRGNYLADPNENPKANVFNQALANLKSPSDNFNRILFSSFVHKMNRHFKTQLRVIVLTDKYLYRLDDKFKSNNKPPIPIKDILAAQINDDPAYQLIVLKCKNLEKDFVIYLESNNKTIDRVPEFLANIYRCRIDDSNKLNVNVLKTVKCAVQANKEKSILIRKNGTNSIQFKKDGDVISLFLPA